MAGDDAHERKRRRVDRERVVRTLTFWLRPEFVLRVVSRFQKVAGFDRAIALASGALTATIPLTIVVSTVATELGGQGTAERIISRYELTGGGAEAVKDIFEPPSGMETSLGIVGFFFLMIAVLSFTRAMQRLFEQTWELDPMSVRNTFNGLLWIAGLVAYLGVSGLIHVSLGRSRLELSAALLAAPLSAVFLVWSGRVLSAKRIASRDLYPFGILGSVLLAAVLGRRDGLRPASVQHVRDPLRRDRRGVRHDLRALLRHGRPRRLGSGGPGGRPRARSHPPRRDACRGRGPAPVGRGHRSGTIALGDGFGSRSRSAVGVATPREGRRVSSTRGDAIRQSAVLGSPRPLRR